MKKRKNKISKENDLIISSNGFDLSQIPTDLIVEISSRLPTKSLGMFRCVSKGWAARIDHPSFTDLFLMKISSFRPRLLFTLQAEGKWSFFSSPQSLILDQNSSLVVVDNHLHVLRDYSFRVCVPVQGLICTKDESILIGRKDVRMNICNPTTGITKPLPRVKTQRSDVITFFGYDPIEKLYKVLCMTTSGRSNTLKAEQHQVLTLGTGKWSWRMIECSVSHYPKFGDQEICINGILYYLAKETESLKTPMIVCFDVRAEKFKFIIDEAFKDLDYGSTLINYKGKLGVICSKSRGLIYGSATSFELWIIGDIEKHKWSRHIHVLPPLWRNLVGKITVYIVGIAGTSDIVFCPCYLSNPFYIFIYNTERSSVRKVQIQGIGPVKSTYQRIYTFTNHIENLKFIV